MELERTLGNSILFVGADDSNNHDKFRARVYCTTFSTFQEDGESKYQNIVNTDNDFNLWFKQSRSREFRFCLLTDPEISHMQPMLPLTIPHLVLDYVPDLNPCPKKLWLSIDGPLPRSQEFFLRRYLEKYFPEGVIIRNFVKRNSQRARTPLNQRNESPTILEMAHTKARTIYGDLTKYIESPRRVELNSQKLKDTYLKLRNREL
jgi:hypothetical protein